jgi:hypothetical protein
MPLGVSEMNGLPVITSSITINGGSTDRTHTVITREGGVQNYRLICVAEGGSLTLRNATLKHGDVGAFDSGGGGILNFGTLTVEHVKLGPGNNSGYGGGLLSNGTAILDDCDVSENEAGWGGGLYVGREGNITILNSEVTANGSPDGGGIINFGELTVNNCFVAGNRAIAGAGVATYDPDAITTILNSTITQNTSSSSGAGVYNRMGTTLVNNCKIYGNVGDPGKGVANEDNARQVDAKSNWWGKSTGPDALDVVGDVDTSSYQSIDPPSLTFWYNRRRAAQYAIEQSRSNFEQFPSDYPLNGSDTRLSLGSPDTFHGSVGSERNYSRILDHRPGRTGSSIFVSESIFAGGLPMTIDADDVGAPSEAGTCCDDEDACPGAPIDVIGTLTEKGWRYCSAVRNNWSYGSAKPNWRDHNGIKLYFANDSSYFTIDASFGGAVESSVNFDNRRGSNKAGTLEVGGQATLSALFDGVDVRVGDYIFVELTDGGQTSDHGFIIVGWGPVPDNLLSALDFTPSFHRSASNSIPYVADFNFGVASSNPTQLNTGWLQDPRPRPFYASAVEIYADQLTANGYTSAQLDKFRDGFFQPFLANPNSPRNRPNWRFYRIPDTQMVPLNRIYFP